MKNVIIANEDTLISVGLETIFSRAFPDSHFFLAKTSSEMFEVLNTQKIDVIILSVQILLNKKEDELLQKFAAEMETKILIFFDDSDYAMLLKWLNAGACTFFTNKDLPLELEELFGKAINTKELHFSKTISKTGSYLSKLPSVEKIKINSLNKLTPKEDEVLNLVCLQHSNKQIALIQNTSLNTVLTHRNNILIKSGAKNMAGLCFYAIKLWLLKTKKSGKFLIPPIHFLSKITENSTEMIVII